MEQGYGDQGKFTHADFVQYLQNLDDAASPQQQKPPQSVGKARTPTSPEYGAFGGSPGSSAQSPIVPMSHGGHDKAAGVQRTLKSQLADLQMENKSLSEELRRTKKELDRKGGGAGEGVQWFSASTMKTKLAQMESSWQRDMERRLAQSEREAADFLASRLAEQAAQADAHWGKEVEGALFRQSEDLTKRFNDEAAATKRDFEQRFEQVLSDVEAHKRTVGETSEVKDQEHARKVEALNKKVRDLEGELRASREVDAIGRRTDAEAAQSRYEKEIASLKAEAQAQLEAAVHDAVSAKHAAMEGLIAEREAAMDAAYAKHLNDTIAQQNQAQAEKLDQTLGSAEAAAAERITDLSERLRLAEAQAAQAEQRLVRENTEHQAALARISGLKSSANEAQQKRMADAHAQAMEKALAEAAAKHAEELATTRASDAAAAQEATQKAVAAALEVAREQAAKDQVLAVSQVQRGVEAEASRSTVELRAAHGEAMSELEGKLAEADEEIAKLREELKQQVAETLQEVEVAREQARFEHVPRDDVEAEVRGLQEQLELLQAEHSAQLKEAYRLRCAQATSDKSEEAAAQMQAAALELPASAWLGSALTTGLVVVVLLLVAGSFLVEVEPFVESPVF